MTDFRVATDIEECREIWRRTMPVELITDLWEVRECFQRHFKNPPYFVVSEDEKGLRGLLPLSWIEETKCYGYFPGETWHKKTWLEQNRIFSRNGIFPTLLDQCPSPYRLRYLLAAPDQTAMQAVVDEVGYLFLPPRYEYDIENYFQEFSQKSSKRLKRDISRIESLGVHYRYDNLSDFEHIMHLSINRFGQDSYFADPRFRESFRSLMHYLRDNGLLRITAALINETPVAVDMGCIYRGTYTLLAGGTHAEYPGIAKLINLHHMKYACEQKLAIVDFLCGDFSWKTLFHLTPRPLHLMSDTPVQARDSQNLIMERMTLAE